MCPSLWRKDGKGKNEVKRLNHRDRRAHREPRKGIMEEWNIGMMGKKNKQLNPLFHHSSNPICFLCALCVLCG
jgi:hypothetical protein